MWLERRAEGSSSSSKDGQWILCPYGVIGCEEKMHRSMLEEHEKKCQEIHLNLAMKKVVSLTVAVEELQERVKQLEELQESVNS